MSRRPVAVRRGAVIAVVVSACLGGSAVSASDALGKGGVYGCRTGEDRRKAVLKFGGSEESEAAVEAALRWLARNQEPDGSWAVAKWGGKNAWGRVGVTGLATLAFLGAGHTEKTGRYKPFVVKAVRYLISKQSKQGAIGSGEGHWGYNHAIAGLALAEAYGMARVRRTGMAASMAVRHAVNIHMYRMGGWRYAPGQKPCTSVTGWFSMFLSSAKTAGLKVDPKGFSGARAHFDRVAIMPGRGAPEEVGGAGYTSNERPTATMTAVAMIARLRLGQKRTGPLLERGADFLLRNRSEQGPSGWYLYLHYYGGQAMFQMGGDRWEKWNETMRDTLVREQIDAPGDARIDGSWEPVSRGGQYGGRVYSTAMACMSLEVYYRYKRVK